MGDAATLDRKILVQSHNVDLGDSLREYAEREFKRIASQFFGKVTSAEVHFRREGSMFVCTGTFKVGKFAPLTARGEHIDIHQAFKHMHRRLGEQLSKLKRAMRKDKPQRIDKGVQVDGEVRVTGQRGHYEPHLPQDRPARLADAHGLTAEEPPPNLLTSEGADAYAKAQVQQFRQGQEEARKRSRSASEDDIRQYRERHLPAAAE